MLVLGLVSLGLGLWQLLRAGALQGILEYDDGVWFGSALRLADGALPYRDFVMDQPPGVPVLLLPVALLSHVTGAATSFAAARLVTVTVEAVNVVLTGMLLRHRSALAMAVAAGTVALYPAAVLTSRTVMLEPYCDLWCLIGLTVAYQGGNLGQSRRRLLVAGAMFGLAGACKAFAVLPFAVLVVQVLLARSHQPGRARRAAWCVLGAGGAFAGICAPFLVAAPAAFARQVVVTQLGRTAVAMPDLWARLAQLTAVPPAPSSSGVPGTVERLAVVAVLALLAAAVASAWRAGTERSRGRGRAGSAVERGDSRAGSGYDLGPYSAAALVVTMAGLTWPAAFYYHYPAFLAPFAGLCLGTAADRWARARWARARWAPKRWAPARWRLAPPPTLSPAPAQTLSQARLDRAAAGAATASDVELPRAAVGHGGRWRALVVAFAVVLLVMGATHAVRVVQTVDQPVRADTAALDRVVPLGACTVTDNPPLLILADRFRSPAGCTDLVDSDGSTLTWAGGLTGAKAAEDRYAVARWLQVLEQSDYVVLTQGLHPGRIPWGHTLLSYLHADFAHLETPRGVAVWERRDLSRAKSSKARPAP